MSEDIHKWTDGRYTLMFDEHTFFVRDNEKEDRMTALEVTKKLNEQQDTNSALRIENNHLIDVIKEYAKKYEEQQATISALKNIFKDIIAYSEWDSEKPYCSLGIAVDKKTYYEIRKILNE